MSKTRRVRHILEVSPAADELITSLASEEGVTKSEFFRRSISLYNVCKKYKDMGKKIGADSDPNKFEVEFVFT